MKVFNKLVRDKIPEKIKENGEICKVRTLTDEEFLNALNSKIIEEVNEYLESGEIEELADLEEILRAIIRIKGYSYEEFENIRQTKVKNRGAFENKLFLEYTDESN